MGVAGCGGHNEVKAMHNRWVTQMDFTPVGYVI